MLGVTQATESSSIARNLRHAMSNYSRSSESGDVTEVPGLLMVDSGVPYAVFNAALPTDSFRGDLQAIREIVGIAARHYGSRRQPWSCWVCEDLIASEARDFGRHEFERLRLQLVAEHTGMAADSLDQPARPLPEMEMRRVAAIETRRDFIRIASAVFHLPPPVARQIYDSERYWDGHMAGWVGYAGGRAVSTAVTDASGGVVGLYSVATTRDQRRRGYGERIARLAVAEAQRESGYSRTILQSTAAGLSLYRRMGYRPSARFAVYVYS